jgi:hypothetical protein
MLRPEIRYTIIHVRGASARCTAGRYTDSPDPLLYVFWSGRDGGFSKFQQGRFLLAARKTDRWEPAPHSLPTFTLRHVFEEVTNWLTTGRRHFRQLLESLNLPPPARVLFTGPSPACNRWPLT